MPQDLDPIIGEDWKSARIEILSDEMEGWKATNRTLMAHIRDIRWASKALLARFDEIDGCYVSRDCEEVKNLRRLVSE